VASLVPTVRCAVCAYRWHPTVSPATLRTLVIPIIPRATRTSASQAGPGVPPTASRAGPRVTPAATSRAGPGVPATASRAGPRVTPAAASRAGPGVPAAASRAGPRVTPAAASRARQGALVLGLLVLGLVVLLGLGLVVLGLRLVVLLLDLDVLDHVTGLAAELLDELLRIERAGDRHRVVLVVKSDRLNVLSLSKFVIKKKKKSFTNSEEICQQS